MPEKGEVVLDNIHDIKARMNQKLVDIYTKKIKESGYHKEAFEKQEKEQAYQRKLAETGAIGITKADQEANEASKELEEKLRMVAQYDPSLEEHSAFAKKVLGSDFEKIDETKVFKGLGVDKPHQSPVARVKTKTSKKSNEEEVLPDEE